MHQLIWRIFDPLALFWIFPFLLPILKSKVFLVDNSIVIGLPSRSLPHVLDIGPHRPGRTRETRGSEGQGLASLPGHQSRAQWHNVIVACQIIKYCSQISLQRNQFQSRLRSGGREPRWLNSNLNLVYQDQKLKDHHLEHTLWNTSQYVKYVIVQKGTI